MSCEHIITVEPDQRSGKPCIRGMRSTVQDVLESLASGMTGDEIPADFSELPREDIQACLPFAAGRERKRSTAAAGEDGRIRHMNPKDAKVVKEFMPVTVSATTANARQANFRPLP